MRNFFAFSSLLGLLSFSSMSLADYDAYYFVKNFELIDAKQVGKILHVTVEYRAAYPDAKFDLVTNGSCAETSPVQCSGVITRLDIPAFPYRPLKTKTFQVDLEEKFGPFTAMHLSLVGPNGKELMVGW